MGIKKSTKIKSKKKSNNIKTKRYVDIKWVSIITICAFLISLFFSIITETIMSNIGAFLGVFIVLLIIIIGVLFDMIGVAITACDTKSFNAMAAKKIKGSKTALWLIKNAEKVSAFCNDVIGDVCGVISGSVGILISQLIASKLLVNSALVTLLVTAIIAALTIGGKAIGKSFAMNKSEKIVFRFAKFINLFRKEVN